MYYLLLAMLLTLTGCASKQPSFSLVIDPLLPSVINYSGEIDPDNVAAFEQGIANSPTQITSLVINSGGGDVLAGIRLGELVYQHKLKVTVDKVCASSCANYVVTASDEVTIKQDALLGWHGGVLQPLLYGSEDFHKYKKSMVEYIMAWAEAERVFFDMVKVNQAVTVLGMMPGLKGKRNTPLYSYDQQTLKALGLHITFEDKQATVSKTGEEIVQIFSLSPEVLDTLLLQHAQRLQQL
ncbi:hypothetical protein ACRN9Z_15140 [Shewanella frigidimarina]|uniref:Lipoprotein n=1 Tax=Shewanella frigidimarina (strain NCIMB 400) TaxID=318167 RepID=Q07YQ8_SHEFN|nr:hypothetical protein [Shewanella frigidimarina]ABI72856.1 hypothetical protein Sfri_3018 [Shewanella frigidimarina NCIMB 400]RPA38506.1 hypothetical protein EGC78_01640 [Shewanella frigidimarina]|tara:strand:+ start:701 stop:1417 length:717 start_codon:yes stop_codon:yes gene_type:complete